MIRRTLVVLAMTSVSLAASTGISQPIAKQQAPNLERVVTLKDGSIYRGEVVELVPQQYLILRLRSGVEKTFRWKEIDSQAALSSAQTVSSVVPPRDAAARPAVSFPASKEDTSRPRNPPPAVERPPTAPAAERWPEDLRQQPKAAPPPIPPRVKRPEREEDDTDESPPEKPKPLARMKLFKLPPDLEPYKDRFVRLTMKSSDKNVQLEYLSESFEGTGFGMWGFGTVNFERWRVACEYPCGELIYRPATFRVTGPDITNTTTFTLPDRRYDMDLNIRPGNPAALGFGITFDILGSLALLGGTGALFAYDIDVNTPGHGRLDDLLAASVITTLVGGAVLAGGIVLTVRGRTSVTVSRTRHDREEDE